MTKYIVEVIEDNKTTKVPFDDGWMAFEFAMNMQKVYKVSFYKVEE